MIECRGICKSFEEKKVLSDFSCSIPDGEITLLMGPSGSGKTTLLSLLLGELTPDSGTISGMPARVGVAFQQDLLCPRLSVADNLRLVLGKTPKADLLSPLEELGLEQDADTRAADLSGGMARRVSLARAVLFDAPLLLLDEPFRGLDEKSRDRAVAFILSHRKGRTLLCVTHDPEDKERLGASGVICLSPLSPDREADED